MVRQIRPKAAPILLDNVLNMELRGGVGVLAVQEIINAGGEFEVLDEVLAEQREVHDTETAGVHPLNGDRLDAAASCGRDAPATAGVLEFNSRVNFVGVKGNAKIEFDEMVGGIRQVPGDRMILGILKRITRAALNSVGPETLEREFHAFGFRVKVGVVAAVKDD